jgi:hypothetical protein
LSPSLISSKDRFPSPFISRARNISFKSLMSLGETYTEIAVSAAYFIYGPSPKFLNFSKLSHLKMCLQMVFSYFPRIFVNHLCYSASSAVSLLSGLQISYDISFLASLEMLSHSSPSNSTRPFRIF